MSNQETNEQKELDNDDLSINKTSSSIKFDWGAALVMFRKTLMIALTVLVYVFFFHSFFIQGWWLMSSVNLILLFLLIRFFIIEIDSRIVKFLVPIIAVATFIQLNIIGYVSGFKIAALIFFNIAVIFLINYSDSEINNRKFINSWAVFGFGVGMFSLLIALSYSALFISKYDRFNLTCDVLYENLNTFIDNVSAPLKISAGMIGSIKGGLDHFFTADVEDVKSAIGLTALSGTDLSKVDLKSLGITGDVQNINLSGVYLPEGETILPDKGIFQGINQINELLQDKRYVDKKICNVTVNEIQSIYNKPAFKFTVMFFLTTLLRPFVRLLFLITTFIGFVIFQLLRVLRVYRFVKQTEQVEEIQ